MSNITKVTHDGGNTGVVYKIYFPHIPGCSTWTGQLVDDLLGPLVDPYFNYAGIIRSTLSTNASSGIFNLIITACVTKPSVRRRQ